MALLHADINECHFFSGNICDSNADCINTNGSFICDCKIGFNKTSLGQSCQGKALMLHSITGLKSDLYMHVDIDECTTGQDKCDENATWHSQWVG